MPKPRKKTETPMKRFNINMPQSLFDAYEHLSDEIGISIAGTMIVALRHYIDYTNTLKLAPNMQTMIKNLAEISDNNERQNLK